MATDSIQWNGAHYGKSGAADVMQWAEDRGGKVRWPGGPQNPDQAPLIVVKPSGDLELHPKQWLVYEDGEFYVRGGVDHGD